MRKILSSITGKLTVIAASLTGALIVSPPATAHDNLTATTSTWERGAVNALGVVPQPWVRKYFGTAGQCLRFEVLYPPPAPSMDVEMIVIAPDVSTRYRNDDGFTAACPRCPLVKINPASVTGYYTVIVQHFSGAAVNSDFILDYRRLPANDATCASPTTPF